MTHKLFFISALVALMVLLTACATPDRAQTSLYDRLGGEAGIAQISKATFAYSIADPRIGHTFADSNISRIERFLAEQICELSGGPCTYSGQTMAASHKGLNLNSMHFNALVENMQKAMDDAGVPYRTQNELLALLAPMHRDIVTKPLKE